MSISNIAQVKNSWLYQQVDVQFPTKESLKGLDLYKQQVVNRQYQTLNPADYTDSSFSTDDIYLVDFHRLTVMFALIQASQWQNETDQEMIVEFLTQIIYSEPCSLYLGFTSGEPVAAAIVTKDNNSVLISDIVTTSISESSGFIAGLLNKLESQLTSDIELIIEQ